MKRAHELQSAGVIAFVDTTSSCDADNHAITFFLTLSTAGAVPLGIIITRGQTEQAYEQGFELLKNAAGSIAFNGKGSPLIFITDNSQAEINALRKTWPTSINFYTFFTLDRQCGGGFGIGTYLSPVECLHKWLLGVQGNVVLGLQERKSERPPYQQFHRMLEEYYQRRLLEFANSRCWITTLSQKWKKECFRCQAAGCTSSRQPSLVRVARSGAISSSRDGPPEVWATGVDKIDFHPIARRMPSRCCVPYCKGNYPTGPKVSIYRFPKDPDTAKKWIQAIQRKNFIPNKASRVCELHFKDPDFEGESFVSSCGTSTGLKFKRLKATSVPTLGDT
ncbi:hypothetical protein JTE90_004168 [Oedothorax gibbosus]|uniref:THAP-type domain-containing protein n=1 Tax=Oedothorax gibbosus TaxID=931172 RepID=A0AAV6TV26_9ARAC|nr:hypothetical protein JTE90_004168 [Oedothorax gibbosus]